MEDVGCGPRRRSALYRYLLPPNGDALLDAVRVVFVAPRALNGELRGVGDVVWQVGVDPDERLVPVDHGVAHAEGDRALFHEVDL